MKTNFVSDLNVEAEVSKFIDKYMYPFLGYIFERQASKAQQKKGIDVILRNKRDVIFIDDKCAIYYANKNLRTFTFELSYLKDSRARDGWFTNREMSTTHYNLMWLCTKDESIKTNQIKFEDIKEVESMFIPKKMLLTYLQSVGYDLDSLSDLEKEFRLSDSNRKRLTPHIELIKSTGLGEKPINLKINKTELAKLAFIHMKVTDNDLLDLKTNSVIKAPAKKTLIQPPGLKAELIVLDAMEKYTRGRDCHLFLHFPLHKKGFQGRNEIDILTVDRKNGISVVEVKGITINQIESIHGGDWNYTDDFYTKKGNPYKQGETQLNYLCSFLEEEQSLFRSFTKRVVVALPYITRSEWEGRGFHKLVNSPPILFKDDLKSVEAIKQFENYHIYKANRSLDDNQWTLMKQFFAIESDSSISASNPYSILYIFPTKEAFEDRKGEVNKKLENGIKVFMFCYFELDERWKNTVKDYEGCFQLQCFTSNGFPPIYDVIEVEDGEEQLPDFLIADFEKFNHKQYQAVHAPHNQKLMVTAGAGTGKTHVMIDRIMFLLTKDIPLEDVIMITFTNDSTNEMKKRLQKKLTNLSKLTGKVKYGIYAESVKDMQISTIHTFSKTILTTLAHEIGYGKNVRIRSFVYEKKQILRSLIDEYCRMNPGAASIHRLPHYKLVEVLERFWDEVEKKGLSKHEMQTLRWGEAIDDAHRSFHLLFQYVFEHCEERLDEVKKEENAVSINDLIRKINEFNQDETKMDQLHRNKYLFMDEFQDSDNVQIDLVASLANFLGYTLFVVGDVKQSIYRFRGADYKSFDLLDKKVDKIGVEKSAFQLLSLNQNYRTASTILNKLDALFAVWGEKDWLTYEEKLVGMNGRKENVDEFQFIGTFAKQAKDATVDAILHSMKRVQRLPAGENRKIALIVRTNKQAKEVNEWCKAANIKTLQNLDGTFYTSQAVRDFKSLLDGLLYPGEAKYVLNTLRSPYFRYDIPYKTLLPFQGRNVEILSFIESKIGSDFTRYVDQLKTYPVMAVIQKIISEKAVFHHLDKYYREKSNGEEKSESFLINYKKNLFHLMNIIQMQFDLMNTTLYNIHQWLTLQMRTNRTENEPMVEATENAVEITTVHRSKGLEYHTVIIPKTVSPFDSHHTAFYIEEHDDEQNEGRKVGWYIKDLDTWSSHYKELEGIDEKEVYKEETRLLYVAMTRVEERLVVIMPRKVQRRTWAEIIVETGIEVESYGS